MDGPTISYTDTGIKIMEGNYVNGLLEGEVLGYNREKGYLSAKSTYKADKLEGIATYYNAKGSVIETKQYRSNNLDGEMITYDSIGRIVRTQLYSNGQLVSVEPKFTIEQSGPLDESAPAFPCDPSLAASNNCSERSLMVYLAQNIRYPSQARELNIQGKASVTFVVDKDGSIKDIQVLRGHCNAIRNECIRVVSNMPKWTPGHVNGKPVKVRYTLPISFKLE